MQTTDKVAANQSILSFFDLLLQDPLECHGISSELRDTFPQLLHGHDLLVEIEAEIGLVVEIGFLGNVECLCVRSDQLLGNLFLRVIEVFKVIGLIFNCQQSSHPINYEGHTEIVK